MNKKIANVLSKCVQFICRVNAPYSVHEMTEERCEEIINAVQAGDVILLRTEGELSTMFQPSKWTHSMLVVNQIHCFEAKITGTRISDMMYALARCDEAILLRPKFLIDVDHLSEYALALVNKPYDFKFESSDAAYYCHEACCKILAQASGIEIPKVKTLLGEKWLPDSFLKSGLFTQIL